MYPLDQENLLEDDVLEFVHYYLSLNKLYLKTTGKQEVFDKLQEFGYTKDLLKSLKTIKDSKAFYEELSSFEANFPYGAEISSKKSLAEKCEYLYEKLATLQLKELSEYSDTAKAVRKIQRELDNQYEELFPITKTYKDSVGELKAYSAAMSDPNKLIAVYRADTSGISINEFKDKVKEAYSKMLDNVKKSRTECFAKLQNYYIKFQENLIAQRNLENSISM